MARPHAIGAALTGILMLAPAAFAAEAIRVEVRPGGVVGLGARGAQRGGVGHPSLSRGGGGASPARPEPHHAARPCLHADRLRGERSGSEHQHRGENGAEHLGPGHGLPHLTAMRLRP